LGDVPVATLFNPRGSLSELRSEKTKFGQSFSPNRPGPKGPSDDLMAEIFRLKQQEGEDHRVSYQTIANELGISKQMVQRVFDKPVPGREQYQWKDMERPFTAWCAVLKESALDRS
jgi:DNA invertase Pin-like site-specific DNA recombinase